MTRLVTCTLNALAMAKNPRVATWYGVRASSSKRAYRCHVCGIVIDTESAQHAMTDHAIKAIDEHRHDHHDAANELIEGDLWPVSKTILKRTFGPLDGDAPIPGRRIVGVWCVSYGVYMALMLGTATAGKVARRKVMERVRADSEFGDALDAAAVVPSGVTNFLRSQGFAIKEQR